MKIFPAIDLLGGKAVRLTKGDYSTAKTYSDDPVSQAASFRDFGAQNLHVVDLDGAKSGKTENGDVIRRIVESTDMFVEVGGGIRDESRIEYYLSSGAGRVILGTAAVRDPLFLKRAVKAYGDKIAVGVDVKDGFVAVDGWTKLSDKTGYDFVRTLASEGVKTVIYTDISKDGTLLGTNLEIYGKLKEIRGINVIASGGISFISEIKALKEQNVYGAIVGKAVYEGKLDLKECIAAAEGGENC